MHVLHVVGARPNFMKAAPVMQALQQRPGVCQTLIHTGQHYDANMSDVFFAQLDIPVPDLNLRVGSGSHARQTADIMIGLEAAILARHPDIVLVYGDVNSTVAAALVCAKLSVKVGHVEAGLRSFDRTMPEEINRIVTDRLADLLFTPSADADVNLQAEGIEPSRIFRVGNVMIDSLIRILPHTSRVPGNGLPDRFALVTLHRPSNVDDASGLAAILNLLLDVNAALQVVFPVHPRTRQRIESLGSDFAALRLIEPLPYTEFIALQQRATVVITDSGGIQEETTYLGIPCLTMRDNTERPVTTDLGTNILVGQSGRNLRRELQTILEGEIKSASIPPLWDGCAGERIADVLCSGETAAETCTVLAAEVH